MIFLQLFWEYFKVGLFSVGGGLATIPFLYDLSDKTHWFTHAQLADMIAVSESTPGPIGVNMATYVGFTTAGIAGAVISTLGLVAPSIIVILIVAKILQQFRQNRYVDAAFYGLRPASAALITAAGITVFMIALLHTEAYTATGVLADLFNWPAILLAAVIFVFSCLVKQTKNWHPIIFIGISAVVGAVFHLGGV